MGPKGKGVKGKPSKQAKGRKKKEGEEEEEEEENERAISPQPVMPVVDAEGMDTGSNREEEDEPDDDEVTGIFYKEKYNGDSRGAHPREAWPHLSQLVSFALELFLASNETGPGVHLLLGATFLTTR